MEQPPSKRVQFPRDTTQVNDQYIGPPGQVTVDYQRQELRLHDGRTPGGWRIPNIETLLRLFMGNDTELGSVDFADEARGFMTRTDDKTYALRVIEVLHGLTILNEDGVAGNPTFGLPTRLRPKQAPIADANLALESGFYIVGNGASSNLPAEWLTTSDCGVLVFATDEAGDVITQIAFSSEIQSPKLYFRHRVSSVFTAWATWSTPEAPQAGTQLQAIQAVDEVKRLWSAKDIGKLVRAEVSGIQYIDTANAAQAYSMNEIFLLDGVGMSTTTAIQGPFNMATNDRFEIFAGATAAPGESKNATIEVEVDSAWQTLASAVVTAPGAGPAASAVVSARIIKTAGGYQTSDAGWNPVSTITGVLSGRFRVTFGAAGAVGARGTRLRKI